MVEEGVMTVFASEHMCSWHSLMIINKYEDAHAKFDPVTNIDDTVATFGKPWTPPVFNAIKIQEDVDRYNRIIEDTEPEVIIELGTSAGGAAQYYASIGLDVITVDIVGTVTQDKIRSCVNKVTWIVGDSIDRNCYNRIRHEVAGRRCMLSVDSDHHACHVLAEMDMYSNLVTVGCYMVVEDGIFRWLPQDENNHWPGDHGPLSAIEAFLEVDDRFEWDDEIERMHSITMNVGGWLRRIK